MICLSEVFRQQVMMKREKEMKDRVKANILNILSKEYGVDEEDFLSAEIEVVPAGAARDYGFDRSMIMGYGHDDRVCAYPSFAAMLEIEKPQHTSVCLLVDKRGDRKCRCIRHAVPFL